MITELSGRACAKINLFLRVTGRRDDGYHELDSVFLPLTLADEIRLEIRAANEPSVTVTCNLPELARSKNNLAASAARSFMSEFDLFAGVSIDLKKLIPIGAGLGGGSSDAATVLCIMAASAQLTDEESMSKLRRVALSLGADVPFFLDPRPSRVTGIGERIVAIEGVPTANLTRADVVQRLRGPAGSRVEMALARAGQKDPLKKSVARAYISVPTVTGWHDNAIAVIRISSFNQHTTDSLREEFGKLRKEMRGALRGVILDMRGNPGGLLDQSVSVAGLFMNNGRIVSTRGRNPGSLQIFDATTADIAGGLPMAVLINGGSASAAEIVAAALQDSGRAIVVGSASFGKGTVQTVLRLPNDGELTLTWARLITPAGYILHEHGVVPNVCTSGANDDEQSIATIIKQSAAIDVGGLRPRVTLDEPGWSQLRGTCPTQTGDHKIEVETAKRLLADPALYAHIIHVEPPSVAAMTTARHVTE